MLSPQVLPVISLTFQYVCHFFGWYAVYEVKVGFYFVVIIVAKQEFIGSIQEQRNQEVVIHAASPTSCSALVSVGFAAVLFFLASACSFAFSKAATTFHLASPFSSTKN